MRNPNPRSSWLTRSPDGLIGGICEGLGRHLSINPNWFRLAWLVTALFFGTGLLLYVLLWWVMPRADALPEEPAGASPIGEPPLRRTVVDRKIFGVCGGIARRWAVDPTAVRLAALALFTASIGLVTVAYLIASIAISRGNAPERQMPHPVEF